MQVTAINKSQIVERLKKSVMEITFTKVNKDLRAMLCTLDSEYLPLQTSFSSVFPNDNENSPITVWDLEKGAWRSIKPETIISVKLVE